MRFLELLIPARDLDAGKAAIDHGADAVYIGGPGFGARSAAGNHIADIAKLVDYARPYGVGVYATFNTLIYENELREAERQARELISAGVDALIVQDPAVLMMGLKGVAFHASTQMGNTDAEHVRFLAESGFSRVVLERWLTISEVARIASTCPVETECFVHGAICVGYRGKCYLSRSMGPRSGNRGVCGQPCRLKYDLEDGSGRIFVRDKHLLSVRDLNLSGHIGRLIDAGVSSFKVEGRLKDARYVSNITAYYRERIDAEIKERTGFGRSSDGTPVYGFRPNPARTFSRGFTVWTADGARAGSATFESPKPLGHPVGRVDSAGAGFFTTDKPGAFSAGDGICFFSGGQLCGTNINRVEGRKVFPNRMDGIGRGMEIYRNYDHRFTSLLDGSKTRRTVAAEVTFSVDGCGIDASAKDGYGNSSAASVTGNYEPAKDAEKILNTIRTQLGKSGDTIFTVRSVDPVVTSGPVPFIPLSDLNALRRELLRRLTEVRLASFEERRKHKADTARRNDNFPYPAKTLGGDANVTNSLARGFWRMHGVDEMAPGFDLRDDLDSETVMVTPYCILREIGRCRKEETPARSSEYYLRTGDFRYRLEFDCGRCRMSLVKCPSEKNN